MICVSISEKDFHRCHKLVKQFECCEIRLDLCSLSKEDMHDLFGTHKKLVATYRPGTVGEDVRKAGLIHAIESGAAYVDIEIESDISFKKELIEVARKHSCASIISYHNFEFTPGAQVLENIIEEGFSYGADIVKIATYVKTEDDNAALMSVYKNKRRLVVFGMGDKGLITRIAAPWLGAEFTFACVDDKSATAPGQISHEKLTKIYDLINKQ